jgi:hypothetical protein
LAKISLQGHSKAKPKPKAVPISQAVAYTGTPHHASLSVPLCVVLSNYTLWEPESLLCAHRQLNTLQTLRLIPSILDSEVLMWMAQPTRRSTRIGWDTSNDFSNLHSSPRKSLKPTYIRVHACRITQRERGTTSLPGSRLCRYMQEKTHNEQSMCTLTL